MSGAGMAGGVPLVTGLLLVYYAGYVLWAGTRLLPLVAVAAPVGGAGTAGTGGSGGNGGTGWGDRAELALACRLLHGARHAGDADHAVTAHPVTTAVRAPPATTGGARART